MAAEAVAGATLGIVLLIGLLIITVVVCIILLIVFWIFMLIDAAKRNFKNDTDKIVWILVIVLVGIIGAAIYYFIIKRKNKH